MPLENHRQELIALLGEETPLDSELKVLLVDEFLREVDAYTNLFYENTIQAIRNILKEKVDPEFAFKHIKEIVDG